MLQKFPPPPIMDMRVVRYDRDRRRVWVFNARVHHGLVGAMLVVGGVILIWDDAHDFPWLKDA